MVALPLLVARLASAQPAALVGRVLADRTEAPVSHAVLELPVLGRSARSDSAGVVRLANVPPGAHRVRVRAIGYQAFDAVLRFTAAETLEPDFLLAPTVTLLRPVRVEAALTALGAARLKEFEERRRMGLGKFLDAEYFERNAGRSVASLIVARIGGLTTVGTGSGEQLRSRRYGLRCVPRTIVNGLPVDMNAGALQASELIGFEFHTQSSVPARYNIAGQKGFPGGSECGTVIFWTK